MPRSGRGPLIGVLDAIDKRDTADQRFERYIIIEEMTVSIECIMVDLTPGVDTQTSPVVGAPRAVLHVFDTGDDEARPRLADSEDLHGAKPIGIATCSVPCSSVHTVAYISKQSLPLTDTTSW